MADKETEKVEENSVEESSEKESNVENSSVAKDVESSEQTNTEADDDDESKTDKASGKKETSSKKKEDQDDEESSDDEELVGSLDAPLVVEGKRVRKSTEFLSHKVTTSVVVERKRIEIPEGKGEPLGTMPRVQFQLNRIVSDELKPLHKLLYGRPGTAMEVKRNIRLFKGFDIEKGSQEYKKKAEQVDRFTNDSIKRLCDILDVDRKGSKEEVFERLMEFLLCPKASGKEIPDLKKKGSAKKKTVAKKPSGSSKEKKANNKSKKAKSVETVNTDEESDEDEEEEEKESPPKKKKSPVKKSETKKAPKKEKKVVSIKISPGNKAKKAKAKRPKEDDSSDDEPLSKKSKKSPPTDDEIVELVKELLDGADLETVTMKSVCKQVYDRFPDFDLTDRKEFIKDSVKEIIT